MQHSDQRARRAEAFPEDRPRILAGSRSEGHRLSPNGASTRIASDRMFTAVGAGPGARPGLLDTGDHCGFALLGEAPGDPCHREKTVTRALEELPVVSQATASMTFAPLRARRVFHHTAYGAAVSDASSEPLT